MKKIINVSKRIVSIGNLTILPSKYITIDDNMLMYYGNKIQSLLNIGLIKMFNIEEPVNPVVKDTKDELIDTTIQNKRKTKSKE